MTKTAYDERHVWETLEAHAEMMVRTAKVNGWHVAIVIGAPETGSGHRYTVCGCCQHHVQDTLEAGLEAVKLDPELKGQIQ